MVKTEYVNKELLDDYIKRSGLKIAFIAETLGISVQAFRSKCVGKISFRASEVYVLCDLLKIADDDKPKIFCLAS